MPRIKQASAHLSFLLHGLRAFYTGFVKCCRFSWKMLSINWEDHSIDVMRLVADMYKNIEFTDCALDTDGGLIHAHKTILVACSLYFQKLFRQKLFRDLHGMIIIPLKEVNYKDMKLILDFIYYGETYVRVTDMGVLRQSAELLQISSLQRACQNFLDTYSSKDVDGGGKGHSGTKFGQNFMEHSEREIYVHVNRCVGSQDLHQNTELGFFDSCLNIHQLSSGCGTKPGSDTKSLSEKAKEDQSEISYTNTRVIKMDTINNDGVNVQDELPPPFVAVSPIQVQSEALADQESESCVTDPLLKNPLEFHPNDSNAFKVENVIKEISETKMEIKQETEFSPLDIKSTENGEGNMFLGTEHIFDIQSNKNTNNTAVSSFCSGDCNLDKNQDLEIHFESFCVPDLKEEKPCLTELNVENTEDDDEPFSLKQGNEESCIVSMQDMNRELGIKSTNKLKLKNAVVVLQRIQLPYQVEAGVDKSAFNEIHDSPMVQKFSSGIERELKKCPCNEDTFNCSHRDPVISYKVKCKHISSYTADEVCFGCSNNHVKHDGLLNSENSFSCKVCNALFRNQIALKNHMRCHINEKPFNCAECDVSFNQKGDLNNHMRIHTVEKPFKCVECEASFCRKKNLKSHMRKHSGMKPFKCGVCDVSFIRKWDMKKHTRIHTGEKPFKCGVCDVSFSQKGVLKRHIMTIHTGEKPFKCGVCDVSFSRKESLVTHMRIHIGEKPFKCVHCDGLFTQRGNLITHMRIHTGVKPFKCGVCESSFNRKDNLKVHMRIHSDAKSFSSGMFDS